MRLNFKMMRSFIGKRFNESQQMRIVVFLSGLFWGLRKYFLGVERDEDLKFSNHWKKVKIDSSLDKERSYNLYQFILFHNETFKNQSTNALEFGVSRGSSLKSISKFIKKDTVIFAIDQFGDHFEKIKISEHDDHYLDHVPFSPDSQRFKKIDHELLANQINEGLHEENKRLVIINDIFPLTKDNHELAEKKYSFVYVDFDIYQSTYDVINFLEDKLLKNAIIVFDDFNFINQGGVKKAIKDSNLNLNKCFQTSSGQLIFINI